MYCSVIDDKSLRLNKLCGQASPRTHSEKSHHKEDSKTAAAGITIHSNSFQPRVLLSNRCRGDLERN